MALNPTATASGASSSSSTAANDVADDENYVNACPICLSRDMEDRALADVCFHSFCFECLHAWSKVNPSCPLCKQPFTSIIHNIQSETLFDQFAIQPTAEKQQSEAAAANERRWTESYSRFQPSRRSRSRRHGSHVRVAATVERRQAVYAAQLRVMPEYEDRLKVRLRDISPAAMLLPDTGHRLTPWLERELKVLVGNSNVSFVTNYVLSLIQKMDFRCTTLVKPILEPFLGRYTEHFLHEFVHYAMSPLDMVAYDQHARYQPPAHRQRRDADRYFRLVDRVLREQAEQTEADGSAVEGQDQAESAIVANGDRPPKRPKSHGLNPYGWGHSSEQREQVPDNDDSNDITSPRSRWETPSPSPERYLEPATPPHVRDMARDVLQQKRDALEARLSQRQRRPPASSQSQGADKEEAPEQSATEMSAELRKMSAAVAERKQRVLKMKMASMQAVNALQQGKNSLSTGLEAQSSAVSTKAKCKRGILSHDTASKRGHPTTSSSTEFAIKQAITSAADAQLNASKLLRLKARKLREESQPV
eukprot:m.169502 g.169502  ORF g.169502 m.169502 type:complete len:535 (+) comp16669_c0_seq6:137-1741(+)